MDLRRGRILFTITATHLSLLTLLFRREWFLTRRVLLAVSVITERTLDCRITMLVRHIPDMPVPGRQAVHPWFSDRVVTGGVV